ncbi:glycoside hydrolase family 26 protein [Winogradskyella sp.]|uniref:glycoside hydrolase family 26 protein n=1 Tax=Winogradskyella sp. TaxID=1883156 RepID=UPI003BAABBD9
MKLNNCNKNNSKDYPKLSLKLMSLFMLTILLSVSFQNCANTISNNVRKNEQTIHKMISKIDTTINSEYIYQYEKTKYVPTEDKTLLILGQSLTNINDYRAFTNYKNYPGGWSAYWAVTEFAGFSSKWTTISGDTQYHGFLASKFDNMVMHSAMWMVGKWGVAKKTINGEYDHIIKKYSDWAKSINKPIYLRLGYEFDGPHNEFEPSEYVAAYKHIVDLMRSEGVKNVAYVWHSYAAPTYKSYPLSEWYPGDDYVDWVGISVFFQPYDDIFNHKETNVVLDFAKTIKKPVMIAESNPVLGINSNDKDIWDKWFVDFFSFCYSRNIKAIAFINEDWNRLRIDGIEDWGDSKLYNNENVGKAWLEETNKPRYLKQSATLFEQLGYTKQKNND